MALNSMEVQKLSAIFGSSLANRLVTLLNKIDGVSAAEVNVLDSATAGDITPGKAIVANSAGKNLNALSIGITGADFSVDTNESALIAYLRGLPTSDPGVVAGQLYTDSLTLKISAGGA